MNTHLAVKPTKAFRTAKSALGAPASFGLTGIRLIGLCVLVLLASWSALAVYLLSCGESLVDALIPMTSWRIERRVDAERPLIKTWANDVRAVTSVPSEQAAVAEEAVWHLVRYWNSHDRDENDCIPSIDDMISRAKSHQWNTLRGNCVSESIMLCSLLRSLGISAQIKNTPYHAWVEFQMNGKTLCTLLPELSLSREADLPSSISRPEAIAAAQRLGADAKGVFPDLDLLPEAVSEQIPHFRRPAYLALALPVLGFWFMVIQTWDLVTSVMIAKKVSLRAQRKTSSRRVVAWANARELVA